MIGQAERWQTKTLSSPTKICRIVRIYDYVNRKYYKIQNKDHLKS